MNYIITFGCPPDKGTPAKSTIALGYFQRLKKEADPWSGEVTLPHALITWQGMDGQAETLPKVRQLIKMKHSNWVRPPGAVPPEASSNDEALIRQLNELKASVKAKEDKEEELKRA